MSLIKVQNLNFDYPTKRILKNVNFEIAEGSVTALVGPNGAGKTTLMRCMTSLEQPLNGHVFVNGIDVHDNPRQAHRHMGYLSDFFGVYATLTVRQCLTYMAWCHKLQAQNLKAYIENLAQEIDIAGYLDTKAGALSRGYKQRLGVGLALVHNPKCLLLDEPASGMDPEARIKFSELIIKLQSRGMTIIVSSHILAELEDYCTDMLVIRDGEIKTHVLLKDHRAEEKVILQIGIHEPTEKQIALIEGHEETSDVKISGDLISLTFSGNQADQAAFLKFLLSKKIAVYQFTPIQKTLKSAYMDLADKKEIEKS